MAIHLRDKSADVAVRRLARLTGKSLTDTIKDACEHELQRLKRGTPLMSRLRPLLDQLNAHPRTGKKADKKFFDGLSGED
jgi:hypothetical protein